MLLGKSIDHLQGGAECELESEGYTVYIACNDYEGLPPPLTGFIALPTRPIQYVVIV